MSNYHAGAAYGHEHIHKLWSGGRYLQSLIIALKTAHISPFPLFRCAAYYANDYVLLETGAPGARFYRISWSCWSISPCNVTVLCWFNLHRVHPAKYGHRTHKETASCVLCQYKSTSYRCSLPRFIKIIFFIPAPQGGSEQSLHNNWSLNLISCHESTTWNKVAA